MNRVCIRRLRLSTQRVCVCVFWFLHSSLSGSGERKQNRENNKPEELSGSHNTSHRHKTFPSLRWNNKPNQNLSRCCLPRIWIYSYEPKQVVVSLISFVYFCLGLQSCGCFNPNVCISGPDIWIKAAHRLTLGRLGPFLRFRSENRLCC